MCCDPKGPCYKCGLVTSVRMSDLFKHGNAFWYCTDCHPEPTDLFSKPAPSFDTKSIPTKACLCGHVTQLWRVDSEDRIRSWLCARCYPGSRTDASSHVEACFDQKGPCHECGRITSIRYLDARNRWGWYCVDCHPGPAKIFSERIIRSWRNAIPEGSCPNCYHTRPLWRKPSGGELLCAKCFSRNIAGAGARTA